MAVAFEFLAANCTDSMGGTADNAAALLNSLGVTWENGILSLTTPNDYYMIGVSVCTTAEGETEGTATPLAILYSSIPEGIDESAIEAELAEVEPNTAYSVAWEVPEDAAIMIVNIDLMQMSGTTPTAIIKGIATQSVESGDTSEETTEKYIYPTGTLKIGVLGVTPIGFKGFQNSDDISHVQISVAKIHADGTVGGDGYWWRSKYFDKNLDTTVMLDDIVPMCQGESLTNFSVQYIMFSLDDEGNYKWARQYLVGGNTNVTTFSVTDETATDETEDESVTIVSDDVAYCLSPVLLKIGRNNVSVGKVVVHVGDYSPVYEFAPDRATLQIDIAEFLQVLWADADIFEVQQTSLIVRVYCYDTDGNEVAAESLELLVIYGKKPDPTLPDCQMRLQWVDKYGYLHDEYFRIVESSTEGSSVQKYTVNREEREDKDGEKSITLAYINANSKQREALKTLVFADHIRAYLGEEWKRVKVGNNYKTGKGRIMQNFEFTIKYTL